mmetsp:Transcript_68818/g.135228  ORF Transcript_68818/g.135228 Transcript_68818/m.135228 type:complete len:277 (+) Transcript_68818:176-1006(+)
MLRCPRQLLSRHVVAHGPPTPALSFLGRFASKHAPRRSDPLGLGGGARNVGAGGGHVVAAHVHRAFLPAEQRSHAQRRGVVVVNLVHQAAPEAGRGPLLQKVRVRPARLVVQPREADDRSSDALNGRLGFQQLHHSGILQGILERGSLGHHFRERVAVHRRRGREQEPPAPVPHLQRVFHLLNVVLVPTRRCAKHHVVKILRPEFQENVPRRQALVLGAHAAFRVWVLGVEGSQKRQLGQDVFVGSLRASLAGDQPHFLANVPRGDAAAQHARAYN